MGLVRELLKKFIVRTCSPQLYLRFRRLIISRSILFDRCIYEPEMTALRWLISAGDSVADIGANVGEYTKLLSSLVGTGGRVYAFEPISENYNILATVVEKGQLSNSRIFRVALGAQVNKCEMVIPNSEGFTGYYLAHFARVGDSGQREKVEVRTLDELWKENLIERLDFIKCDVEGAEVEVIQGGLEMIKVCLPGWLLEVSSKNSAETFSLLKGLGYRVFVYSKHLVPTENYRPGEFLNYFFIHPDSQIWGRAKQFYAL